MNYVTYPDLIQIGIFIVALVGLCYTVFGKRKQPPTTRNSERLGAVKHQVTITIKGRPYVSGFSSSVFNIAYLAAGYKCFCLFLNTTGIFRQKKKAPTALIFEGVEDSFESSKCYE